MGRGGQAILENQVLLEGESFDNEPSFGKSKQGLPQKSLAEKTADALIGVAERADPSAHHSLTFFDADRAEPPQISLLDYLSRWEEYSETSEDVMTIALIYINRSRIPVTYLNVHRLVLAALILAAKWRDDLFFSNAFYAVVGGVSLAEANRLECALLCTLEWEIHVSQKELEEARAALDQTGKEILKLSRPWEELGEHPLNKAIVCPRPSFLCLSRAVGALCNLVGI